ncbi:hypothetical protein LshimejAT787_0107150 [Lyophyllum shimeji]|uniref:Uncharacterized protein n=1 Tax=Lyophyllum shimeji TaxID=47721 RepID=A0A9P3PDD6_LYOSH|nr:hypothetical protein LshimejAT787_0107150 [Lyophyllum shimeji]
MTKPTNPDHSMSRDGVFKTAKSTVLPTRDELLGFVLDPDTSQGDLHAVSKLLVAAAAVYNLPSYQAMIREATAEKHCVRCHNSFTDDSNKMGACAIPHVFDLNSWGPNSERQRYPSKCCGSRVELKERDGDFSNVHRLEVCYEGYHTEDVEEVEEEEEYNGINVRRCRMVNGECAREVLWADHEPHFLGQF